MLWLSQCGDSPRPYRRWSYEIIPGFFANLLVAIIVSYLTKPPSLQVMEDFQQAVEGFDSRRSSPSPLSYEVSLY
ncbi:MAG: hypothetical protein U1U88_000503 [Lawsonella clevelandensis]